MTSLLGNSLKYCMLVLCEIQIWQKTNYCETSKAYFLTRHVYVNMCLTDLSLLTQNTVMVADSQK